jgi:hypothetical protein
MKHTTNSANLSMVTKTRLFPGFLFTSLSKSLKLLIALLAITIFPMQVYAQVNPYQIPPKWMFGYNAGLNFGTSPFTNSPPLVLTGNPTNNGSGVDAVGGLEASTTVCNPASAVVLYSNQVRYYDGANTSFAFPGGSQSYGSSTDGCVAVPDPNNANQYYMFTANDQTGGAAKGLHYWLYNTSGTMSAVTNLAAGNLVDESLCASSDGNGGYWIIAHGYGSASYYVWHVTTTGVAQHATFPQSPAGAVTQWSNNASIKINRCQDRIAWGTIAGALEVYSWNRNTGTITANLFRKTGLATGIYGLEFSPSGRFVYTGHHDANNFTQHDINNPGNAPVLVSSTNPNGATGVGTMQLGPNNKIYVTLESGTGNTAAVYIGVVNSPDVLDIAGGPGTGCDFQPTGFMLKPNNATAYPNIYLGIANEAWMSPEAPTITLSAGATCSTIIHTIDFETYFNTDINLVAATLEWSFDNGATWAVGTNPQSHNYGGSATTTARARFYDQACNNYQWTASKAISISCPAPVKLVSFKGEINSSNVLLSWVTSQEIGNDYFEIQRSTDGTNFTTIGMVEGAGNSSSVIKYNFTDVSPTNGTNYYRLVQHDFDGKNESSEIIAISFDGIYVNVYPNPSNDEFQIQLSGLNNDAIVVVTDVLGREVYRKILVENFERLSFGKDLPTGTYFLKAISENQTKTLKLVKQN